jgi:hypothetical protein
MREMKRRLLALEAAWKTLDGYAEHAPGCPVIWGPGAPCECGLTNARTRLRETVLEMLTHYAAHDAWCPGATGGECDCGFESARRRLQALAQTPPPDTTDGSLPPKE